MPDTPEISQVEGSDEERAEFPSLVGEVLSGRYRVDAELGIGGMGAVYRAEHLLMRKTLAIKVLHPEMTRQPDIVERFEREALAAAHIEHPNVAAATDFGKLEDGSFFLVLEFVEGKSLRAALENGPLPTKRVMHIGKQIVAALVRAHGLGIVHRDLKPENIMLVERDGDPDFVKVLDFGIAKVPVAEISKEAGKLHKNLTKIGMVYGTPQYMAPEQALGQEVDARADLYALGVMLYEMLMGRRPFESNSAVTLLGMQVTATPPSFREIAPDCTIPAEVETVVMELLEKESTKRPSDAKQVRDALEYLADFVSDGVVASADRSGALGRADTSIATAPSVPSAMRIVLAKQSVDSIRDLISGGFERVQRAVSSPEIERGRRELAKLFAGSLPELPTAAWVGGAVGAGFVVLFLGGVLLCWASSSSEAQPAFSDGNWPPAAMSVAVEQASSSARPEELKAAIAGDSGTLEKLYEKFPNDPAVIKPLAQRRMMGAAPMSAVKLYERLFKIDPKLVTDESILAALLRAADRTTSQEAAFDVFVNHMGHAGPDVLYELAHGKYKSESTSAAARATKELKSADTRKRASPAMLVALDLRTSGSCLAKQKLLDRAKAHGDRRSLSHLKKLLHAKGCGFLGLSDCWKCLRSNRKLTDAVRAIEEREKAKAAVPKPSE